MTPWHAASLAFFLLCWLHGARAQELRRATIWDLKLGQPISSQPSPDEFRGFACGSNGGPPRRPLTGWSGYKLCAAEPNGLHEVYFEYDDEYEYIARARDLQREVARWAGTTEARFPVIVSALFADDGILKAVRMVSDPRPDHRDDTNDADLETLRTVLPARRRHGVTFRHRRGTRLYSVAARKRRRQRGRRVRQDIMRTRRYRRPPQDRLARQLLSQARPKCRQLQLPSQLTAGQFESSARVEIFALD